MDYISAWSMVAITMFILEILIPAFGFLGGGISATMVAIFTMYNPEYLEVSEQVILFSGLSILFIYLIYKIINKKSAEASMDTVVGTEVVIVKIFSKKENERRCSVGWSGSILNAVAGPNNGVLEIGDRYIVESVKGTELKINKRR